MAACFHDYQNNELPERDFMWGFVSTLRPEDIKHLVDEERNSRSLTNKIYNDELIEMTPEFLAALKEIAHKKSKENVSISFSLYPGKENQLTCSENLQI